MPTPILPSDFRSLVPDLHGPACQEWDKLQAFLRAWTKVYRDYFHGDGFINDVCALDCDEEATQDTTTAEATTSGTTAAPGEDSCWEVTSLGGETTRGDISVGDLIGIGGEVNLCGSTFSLPSEGSLGDTYSIPGVSAAGCAQEGTFTAEFELVSCSLPQLNVSFVCQQGAFAACPGEYLFSSAFATGGTLVSISPEVGTCHPGNSTVVIEAEILGTEDGETYHVIFENELGDCSDEETNTTSTTTTAAPTPCGECSDFQIVQDCGEDVGDAKNVQVIVEGSDGSDCTSGPVDFQCAAGVGNRTVLEISVCPPGCSCGSQCRMVEGQTYTVTWSDINGDLSFSKDFTATCGGSTFIGVHDQYAQ